MSTTTIDQLYRTRPRSHFLRYSLVFAATATTLIWIAGGLFEGDPLAARRLTSAARFLKELMPYPLQQGEGLGATVSWGAQLLQEQGAAAAFTTLAIAVLAISIAGLIALPLSPVAARLRDKAPKFCIFCLFSRVLFILCRAVPEYVLAFLLLAVLGPQPWPLILALAIHNLGILGRLGSETIEDLPPEIPRFQEASGQGRTQIFLFGQLPAALGRMLVYFFYRWETCIRDATVLGMLGTATLGFFIVDTRARLLYDEMFFFVLLAVALIAFGDIVSAVVRKMIR